MGMLALLGNNNKASSASILNMTPSEKMFKEQLAFLNSHGINDPKAAVEFVLGVVQVDKQMISAEFQSLREDNMDAPLSAIETAAGIYNRESANRRERKAELKNAITMQLEPAVRTLLRRTQRYVEEVIKIDQMPKVKKIMSPFKRLSAQVDNYSYCARVCFENAVAGMTYARAIDTELGGNYTKSLIEAFNESAAWLTDGNRRCWIMSEYAANGDLEAFWLEVPEASVQMLNSGDWNHLAKIAEKSTRMRPQSTPPPAQIAVKDAKPGLFFRLKRWVSGFVRRLVFLFTGKPFEEQKAQVPVNANSRNVEADAEEFDYEHIVF